jgi:hypothetical protein
MRGVLPLIGALAAVLFAVSIPFSYAVELTFAQTKYASALAELGISEGFFAAYLTFWHVALAVGFTLVGLLIFLRRPDDGFLALVSLACVTASAYFEPELGRLAAVLPFLLPVVSALRALGLTLALVVFYFLMPDGRFVPRWTRWVASTWVGLNLVWLLVPGSPANLVSMETWARDRAAAIPLYLLFFGAGIYAQVHRYRVVSGPIERQQTKWVVFGTTAALAGFVLHHAPLAALPDFFAEGSVPRLIHTVVGTAVVTLLFLLVPAGIGASILRFRLWDVDALISRTLVYGTLTVGLVVAYFVGVIALQQVFIALTSDRSDLALVASTLAIAALFNPLRQALQTIVDRRFYRRRYDAMQVLASVATTIRDEVDLDQLARRLVTAVDEAMQPTHVGIRLVDRVPSRAQPEASRRLTAEPVRLPSEEQAA